MSDESMHFVIVDDHPTELTINDDDRTFEKEKKMQAIKNMSLEELNKAEEELKKQHYSLVLRRGPRTYLTDSIVNDRGPPQWAVNSLKRDPDNRVAKETIKEYFINRDILRTLDLIRKFKNAPSLQQKRAKEELMKAEAADLLTLGNQELLEIFPMNIIKIFAGNLEIPIKGTKKYLISVILSMQKWQYLAAIRTSIRNLNSEQTKNLVKHFKKLGYNEFHDVKLNDIPDLKRKILSFIYKKFVKPQTIRVIPPGLPKTTVSRFLGASGTKKSKRSRKSKRSKKIKYH